jgi:hypothetical protein
MFSIFSKVLLFIFKFALGLFIFYVLFIFFLLILVKTKKKDKFEKLLIKPKKLPLFIDFFRWIVVDLLRGKQYPVWGIYMFVAKPGNGKTISMTEHIERVRKEHPQIKVFTNFNYKHQDGVIKNWKDIVQAPDNSIIAIDEIHMIFGSLNFQDFPIEMLGEITQNRHSRKQFITSTQDYDLVNVNFKRVCNFIVLCKNFWGLDRLFINYYFDRGIYESKNFMPDKRKAEFIRMFVASDETYSRYDTLEKINAMVEEIENKDVAAIIKKLKELKSSSELQAKEQKYISSIIERINSDFTSKELWEQKEREIEELKSKLVFKNNIAV